MKKYLVLILFVIITTNSNAQVIKEIILQPDSVKGIDAWVWSFDPARNINFGSYNSSNYNLYNVLRAEVWKWGGKELADTIRGLIKFDLSDIPNKASIVEAKLSLYHYSNPGFTPQLGNNEIVIEKVVEEWDESKVNWNNQPKSSTFNRIELPKSTKLDEDFIDIDIRNLIQEMVYFPNKNYGFMLKLVKEVEFNGLSFASSDHKNKKLHPKLIIKYISNK